MLESRIVRVRRSRGGLTLYFPPGRGGLVGFMLLSFGAVFAGMGVFAFTASSGMGAGVLFGAVATAFGGVFLVVFGGVGGLMMLGDFYSLVNSLLVEIRNGTVTTRRSFFFPFRRTARFEDIEKIEMGVHSSVGQGAKASSYMKIRAFVRGGRRISLGDDIPLGRQSEILAALLEEAIGIPVEMVKRSGRRLRA
jgi:hypothetical protein